MNYLIAIGPKFGVNWAIMGHSKMLIAANLLRKWWARGDSNARPLPCQGKTSHLEPSQHPVNYSFFVDPHAPFVGLCVGIGPSWAARITNQIHGSQQSTITAIGAALKRGLEAELAVFLIPARTDTRWLHDIVLPKAREIRFLRGRLKFGDATNSAPFPSMVVVFAASEAA